ncbi:MAG: MFS transporter [Novosphingobium sp.]|nr:MFS transporter [Novosphingobium sp.]
MNRAHIPDRTRSGALPRTVWALGFVSLFMDVSSEIVHALLPLFLTATLGASVSFVGVVDGIGEATASITKVFSGFISDRIGKRRPLILLGYGLAAASKPLFALAGSPGVVLGARFADRVGKGIRGAPRDALVADVTAPAARGRAFGLRQALDTIGAFAGPVVAIGLMALFAQDMRKVFWLAALPGIAAVAIAAVWVHDPPAPPRELAPPLRIRDLGQFGAPFWTVAAIGVVMTLARFSEGFLILRAHQLGLPIALAPAVLIVMNLVYAAGAYPAGALADRVAPRPLLLAGLAFLIAADSVLALASTVAVAFAGIAFWGLHMALTQGLLAKLVADAAPAEVVGSAFGTFNLLSGIAMLVASVVAGLLWDRLGSPATFLTGGAFAIAAGLLIIATVGRARD